MKKVFLSLLMVFFVSQSWAIDPKQGFVPLTLEGFIKDDSRVPQLLSDSSQTSLRGLVSILDKLNEDSKVKGIILTIKSPRIGLGKMMELRDALNQFKAKGKKVYAFAETLGRSDYLLASIADKLYVSPQGDVDLSGIALELVFLKGAFDFLGIKPNFHQVGDYKSASEQYTHSSSTKHQRDSINFLLDGIYDEYLNIISKSRNINRNDLKKLVDKGFFSAREAKEANLVDDYLYEDMFEQSVIKNGKIFNSYLKKDQPEDLNLMQMLAILSKKPAKPDNSPKIAVIFMEGVIVSGRNARGFFSETAVASEDFTAILKAVRKDPTVKAVIIRINSPGGSALASDILWREIYLLSQKKPVIASLSDIAASGGYYIAVACPTIIASPTTITGSIGVVGGKFNIKGLYDKLGIQKEIFKRGKHADINTDYRDFSEEEKKVIAKQMEETYKVFVQKVADGRKIPMNKMKDLAQGKVYTGTQALNVGLVDKLGGLNTAIELARKKTQDKGNKLKVISYPEQMNLMDLLKINLGTQSKLLSELKAMNINIEPIVNYFGYINEVLKKERIAILSPFLIHFK